MGCASSKPQTNDVVERRRQEPPPHVSRPTHQHNEGSTLEQEIKTTTKGSQLVELGNVHQLFGTKVWHKFELDQIYGTRAQDVEIVTYALGQAAFKARRSGFNEDYIEEKTKYLELCNMQEGNNELKINDIVVGKNHMWNATIPVSAVTDPIFDYDKWERRQVQYSLTVSTPDISPLHFSATATYTSFIQANIPFTEAIKRIVAQSRLAYMDKTDYWDCTDSETRKKDSTTDENLIHTMRENLRSALSPNFIGNNPDIILMATTTSNDATDGHCNLKLYEWVKTPGQNTIIAYRQKYVFTKIPVWVLLAKPTHADEARSVITRIETNSIPKWHIETNEVATWANVRKIRLIVTHRSPSPDPPGVVERPTVAPHHIPDSTECFDNSLLLRNEKELVSTIDNRNSDDRLMIPVPHMMALQVAAREDAMKWRETITCGTPFDIQLGTKDAPLTTLIGHVGPYDQRRPGKERSNSLTVLMLNRNHAGARRTCIWGAPPY